MAHFAKLNNNSIVEEVLVVDNSEIMNNGVESEIKGIEFLTNLTGYSNWKQTSYNMDKGVHLTGGSPFRLNYAQPGFKYDADLNGFIQAESPYPSWTLNTSTGYYHAPVPRPDPGSGYSWDEESQSWVQ
jgi:hypothetical protein